MADLTHINAKGDATMVDVTDKSITDRTATAAASIHMTPETLDLIAEGGVEKGDVFGVARLAGIMAAKKTHDLIPLCHPLALTGIDVEFAIVRDRNRVDITASCTLKGKTGVEMEALTAVSVAALTIYDMCKAADRAMRISDIRLVKKSGGRSGDYEAE
ncbi:MAG TPA: cyclic pyranopterin monophosphate synthase MoaC [Rhodospirillaceae bacterium]|nr:cyclic pyranopterin monophosphate synthase MoaC [Rhodospirillaceae bacterium]MBL25415.1 cyclic pyranopterin monophosphate synthase MoaC [Rhodospirillaceae bacterium]HAA91912.1 cyclic pyranopterin monophosphate synthase MoaC [Rhodospirillaceae bacterium]HAT36071.1 cyclic pyranopterin monophosphate synthase MoaC [Rhodospirillaceae bacterium]|tara:strand:+ start:101 stop:577 length:477 start_codon:yes stop_codon:yes gene_type:complete